MQITDVANFFVVGNCEKPCGRDIFSKFVLNFFSICKREQRTERFIHQDCNVPLPLLLKTDIRLKRLFKLM